MAKDRKYYEGNPSFLRMVLLIKDRITIVKAKRLRNFINEGWKIIEHSEKEIFLVYKPETYDHQAMQKTL